MTLTGTWMRTRSTLNGVGTKLHRKHVTMTRGRGDAQRCRVAVKRVATIGTALGLSALLYLTEPTTTGQRATAADGTVIVERRQLERLLMKDYEKRVHEATDDQLLRLMEEATMDAPALSDSAEGEVVVEKRTATGQKNERVILDEEQERQRRMMTTENPKEEEKLSPESFAPAASSISEEAAERDGPSLDDGIGTAGDSVAMERPFELSRLEGYATSDRIWMGLQNKVKDFVQRRIQSIGGRRIELNGVRIQRAASVIVAGGILLLIAFLARRRPTVEEPTPFTGPSSAIARDHMCDVCVFTYADVEQRANEEQSTKGSGWRHLWTTVLAKVNPFDRAAVPSSKATESVQTETPPLASADDAEEEWMASGSEGPLWKRSDDATEEDDDDENAEAEPSYAIEWQGAKDPPVNDTYVPSEAFVKAVQDPWRATRVQPSVPLSTTSPSLETLLDDAPVPEPTGMLPLRSNQHVFSNVDPSSIVPLDVLLQRL